MTCSWNPQNLIWAGTEGILVFVRYKLDRYATLAKALAYMPLSWEPRNPWKRKIGSSKRPDQTIIHFWSECSGRSRQRWVTSFLLLSLRDFAKPVVKKLHHYSAKDIAPPTAEDIIPFSAEDVPSSAEPNAMPVLQQLHNPDLNT